MVLRFKIIKNLRFKFQMNSTGISPLQQYRIQRKHREQKRRSYLRQFQVLRQKLGIQTIQQNSVSVIQKPVPIRQTPRKIQHQTQEKKLQEQNQELKQKLIEIQSIERQKLTRFKEQMQKAKLVYFIKIKQLRELELAQKNKTQTKITKLQQQMSGATAKNKQIQDFNSQTQEQCNQAEAVMEKYSNEIRSQYDKKLQDFNTILLSSNQKIKALEDQQNEQQFVEATLQNEQIIQSIKQNAEKADEQIDKIISDYKQLLQGKTQIRIQLQDNNKMKQEEVGKMGALQQKLKTVCEKLGEQKKLYLQENKRMAEQLIQIKNLLQKVMGNEG